MACVCRDETHDEQIKGTRDEKVHKGGQSKKYQGEKGKYETEREGGKGQDYKSSSFRTPKGTEVENNPQPYPARGNSLSRRVTNRKPFVETA